VQFFRYHVCAVGIIKLIQFSYNNCTNWPLGWLEVRGSKSKSIQKDKQLTRILNAFCFLRQTFNKKRQLLTSLKQRLLLEKKKHERSMMGNFDLPPDFEFLNM